MDYIINPWWFYLVQVCGTVKFVLFCFGFILFGAGVILLILTVNDIYDWGVFDKYDKEILKLLKRAVIVGAAMLTIGILLPSEETLIKMQVAKFGTHSNAEKVLKVIDKKTDALIDAIGSVKED